MARKRRDKKQPKGNGKGNSRQNNELTLLTVNDQHADPQNVNFFTSIGTSMTHYFMNWRKNKKEIAIVIIGLIVFATYVHLGSKIDKCTKIIHSSIDSSDKAITTEIPIFSLMTESTTGTQKSINEKCGLFRYDKRNLSGFSSGIFNLEDFPFMVGLIATNGTVMALDCHAFLISPNEIATAAHCHVPSVGKVIKEVYFYSLVTKSIEVVPFSEFAFLPHRKYIYGNFHESYDVAILRHSRQLTTSLTCIPKQIFNQKDMMLIMKFINDSSIYPTKLSVSKVSIVDNTECRQAYKNLNVNLKFYENSKFLDQQLQKAYCVENGDDYTLQGTSGTPLLGYDGSRFTGYGVCSIGGIKGKRAPDLYTNILMMSSEINHYEVSNIDANSSPTIVRP